MELRPFVSVFICLHPIPPPGPDLKCPSYILVLKPLQTKRAWRKERVLGSGVLAQVRCCSQRPGIYQALDMPLLMVLVPQECGSVHLLLLPAGVLRIRPPHFPLHLACLVGKTSIQTCSALFIQKRQPPPSTHSCFQLLLSGLYVCQ